jgi:hypothetical protein
MAAASGALSMTVPAFAGYAIEMADGDVEGAKVLAPEGPPLFRERVLAVLDAVIDEEREPLRAAGGSGR